jgi:hypothetical protein
VSDRECPNCGGADVIDVAPGLQSCAYCGSALTPPRAPLNPARCPGCSYQNQPGARYCNQCGLALAGWTAIQKPKTDPALLSIAATVVGSMFLPVGGAVLGLFLGYKARNLARATGGLRGSEGLARAAIAIGWAGLAFTLLPLFLIPLLIGGQIGVSLCAGLLDLPGLLLGG